MGVVAAAGDPLPPLQPAEKRSRTLSHRPEQLLPQLPEEGRWRHLDSVTRQITNLI